MPLLELKKRLTFAGAAAEIRSRNAAFSADFGYIAFAILSKVECYIAQKSSVDKLEIRFQCDCYSNGCIRSDTFFSCYSM